MILVNYLIKYLFLFSFLILFSTCSKDSNKTIISGNTMGTTYSITISNFIHNEDDFKIDIDKQLNLINQKFSTYQDNSEISKINTSNAELIKLSKEFEYVLNRALYYCELSNGNYDITVGPLVELWGFNSSNGSLPSDDDIKQLLNHIGYEKVSLSNHFLVKKDKNIDIDLNSIAKGYGVDKISEFLNKNGYTDYLVEIGGELRSSQVNNPDDWIVGIQNPQSNLIVKKIKLNNMSMATSGTYNNFFELDGVNYSHILNPKTGYPYKHKTISATVIAKYCIDADAYATLSMTMKPLDVIDLINKANDIEVYMIEIDPNNKIIEYMSSGFKEILY